MKEAVLKIIQQRIDSLKEYSTSLSLRTSKGVIEFQIKEAEAIFRMISALPEQGMNEQFLLHLIDVVWGDAFENESVPSTPHARTLLKRAIDTSPKTLAEAPIEIPENVKLAEAENPYLHELNELARSFGIYEGLPYLQFASTVEKIIRLSPTAKQLADLNRLVDSIAKSQQGYTREQAENIFDAGAMARASAEVWGEIDRAEYGRMKNNYLSSLTPVAVEAERTERWISLDERLPERDQFVLFLEKDGKTMGILSIEEDCNGASSVPWFKEHHTHWMPLPDPPKDSLAPQVNNDKTK